MRRMRFKTKFYIFLYVLVIAATAVAIMFGMGMFTNECEHLHTETVVGKTANCTRDGLTDGKICLDCGETVVERTVIKAYGHTEKVIPAVAPTCNSVGYTEGAECAVCNAHLVERREVAKLPHTPVASGDNPPSCTEAGTIGGTHCSVCYATIEEPTKYVEPIGHTWDTHEAVESTCAVAGHEAYRKCTVCGTVEGNPAPLPLAECLEEDLIITAGVDATCSHSGWTEGVKCKRCGTIHVAQEIIPSETVAHVYDYSKPYTEAVDADCGAGTDGCTASYECLYCGHILEAEIIKWAHTPGEWSVYIPATETAAGENVTYCLDCHKPMFQTVDKLPALLPDDATEEEIEDKFNEDNGIDPDGIV